MSAFKQIPLQDRIDFVWNMLNCDSVLNKFSNIDDAKTWFHVNHSMMKLPDDTWEALEDEFFSGK